MRNIEVRLKLSPEMHTNLCALAARRGLLPASLGAVIVGEYFDKYHEGKEVMSTVIQQQMRGLSSLFDGDALAALMATPLAREMGQQLMASQQEEVYGLAGVSSAGTEAAAHDAPPGASANG